MNFQPLPTTLAALTAEAMVETQRVCFVTKREPEVAEPQLPTAANLRALCALTRLIQEGAGRGSATGSEAALALQAYCVAAEVLRRTRPYGSKRELDDHLSAWAGHVAVLQDHTKSDLERDEAADAVEDLLLLLCTEAASMPSA